MAQGWSVAGRDDRSDQGGRQAKVDAKVQVCDGEMACDKRQQEKLESELSRAAVGSYYRRGI